MQLVTRKSTLLLAVLVLLASATTCFAQGVTFTVFSQSRTMRGEGITEAAGEVVLNAGAGGTVLAGSSIVATFGGAITGGRTADAAAARVTSFNGAASANCPAAGPRPAGSVCPDTFAKSGSQLSLSYTTGVAFPANSSLTISGVRLDVSALGNGVNVTGTLGGSSANPATNPLAFSNPTVVVGIVTKPSVEVVMPTPFAPAGTTFAATDPGSTQGVAAPALLACAPTGSGLPGTVTPPGARNVGFGIAVFEKFPSVFTSNTQETNVTPNLSIDNGLRIRIDFLNVPAGVTVKFISYNGSGGAVVCDAATPRLCGSLEFHTNPASFETVTRTSTGDVDVTFRFRDGNAFATNLAAIEAAVFNFQFGFDTALPAGAATGPIVARVRLRNTGGTGFVDTDDIVRFISADSARGTVLNISECQTNLLFPYVASNVGGFDSGIVIANTSKDDGPFGAGLGATETSGPCTLHAYKASDGSVVTFTTPTVGTGASYVTLLSGISAIGGATGGFQGHILAACRFLNAHGFAFLFDGLGLPAPRLAEGYLALVLANPRPAVIPAGESVGH